MSCERVFTGSFLALMQETHIRFRSIQCRHFFTETRHGNDGREPGGIWSAKSLSIWAKD